VSKPYKTILCIDFETRWSTKTTDWCENPYTLSKMTTEEYIRDEKFHAFGACIHEVGAPTPIQWYSHRELPKILSMYDWSKTAVVGHNAMFDVGILSMQYDINPCFIFDTLSMARAIRGAEAGNSLAKLAEAYGLPAKGRAVHDTNGLWEIPAHMERELADYCKQDVYLCEQIFGKMLMRVFPDGSSAGPYPTKELRLIDMTLRMFTEPLFELDEDMLQKALVDENAKLAAALAKVGVEPSTLASNDKFAEVLRSVGVNPPQKISKQTKKLTWALAKSDAVFQAILNGDNEDAALLCEARLKVKSTLERTRAQRFIDISKRGRLPVPLYYYGASTGRYAATGSINMQNMKRGSFLRKSIMAPDGYVVCAGDLSQIEPRVIAWLSDYEEMLDIFHAGGDPYATFGATMFGLPGMTKESHPLHRQSAKSALLGASYQLGWASFAAQLLTGFLGAPPQRYNKADAKQLGITSRQVQDFIGFGDNLTKMAAIPHTCTDDELLIHCLAAKAIIDKYRAAAEPVTDYWKLLGSLIQHSLVEGNEYNHKGVLTFRKEEIEMVNGMRMYYRDIQQEKDEKGRMQYSYSTGKMRKKLYAGLLANNTTQGLARIIMTDGLLRVQKRFPVKGTVHDEGLILLPEAGAVEGAAWVKEKMIMVPPYMPGIPLNADVGFHKRYGLAKA
jgi:DNA polymerase I-like protein with 3'-5' exonuclease and polymerase domains